MNPTKRIIVNTIVQYIRSFVYMVLMLFTTRYILSALGHSDYGIYSVIGSMVFMLGFITNSLASSTQRFLSFSHGVGDKGVLRSIFANALLLHAGLALVLITFMAVCEPLFMGYLTIPAGRESAGVFVYFMVLLMVILSFVTAPIRALFIARENIIYVSAVEVFDAVFKMVGALILPLISYDSLRLYAMMMCSVSVVNFVAYAAYAHFNYEEFHLPHLGELSKEYQRKLAGFAVWNVYAVGSTVVRIQGLSIIINHFLGTLVNAAYGIALQMNNAVSFVTLSILNSINPQLMKAEGAGDRRRMLMLSTKESKYSFIALALLLTPIIVDMPNLLRFWLGEVPEYTCLLARFILADIVMDQLTIGLTSANQAIGQIRNYSLLTSTIRLLIIPAAWICLHLGLSLLWVMVCFVGINAVIGIIRLPFLKVTAGLSIRAYLGEVVLRNIIPLLGIAATAWLVSQLPDFTFRFVLTETCAVLVGFILVFTFSLTPDERLWITSKVKGRIHH